MNAPTGAASRRILLAEDNAFEARLVLGVLRQMGFNAIRHVNNGTDAIAEVRSDAAPFDLVISDWNMPERTGLDLLQHVRAVWRHTPFLMLTSHATVDFVRAAKANNVDAYMVKPFSPRDLVTRITQLLGT